MSGGSERERLGQRVREVWIAWAREQPNPKASWLVPWAALGESDKEVDRRIGEAIHREALAHVAGERATQNVDPLTTEEPIVVMSEVQHDALLAERARLVAALTPFLPGGDWGRTKAWMVNGAPTKEEGIALARRLTEIQANLERALLADPAAVKITPRDVLNMMALRDPAAATPDATGGPLSIPDNREAILRRAFDADDQHAAIFPPPDATGENAIVDASTTRSAPDWERPQIVQTYRQRKQGVHEERKPDATGGGAA